MKSSIIFLVLILLTSACAKKETKEVQIPETKIVLDETSGLIDSEGVKLVIANCTSCHSAKLIIQNRASRAGWEATIRWMQQTQNLWPLGENEPLILDYLAKNYAPENIGRRKNLENVDWYELKKD